MMITPHRSNFITPTTEDARSLLRYRELNHQAHFRQAADPPLTGRAPECSLTVCQASFQSFVS